MSEYTTEVSEVNRKRIYARNEAPWKKREEVKSLLIAHNAE